MSLLFVNISVGQSNIDLKCYSQTMPLSENVHFRFIGDWFAFGSSTAPGAVFKLEMKVQNDKNGLTEVTGVVPLVSTPKF